MPPEKAVVTTAVHKEWSNAPRLKNKFHWAGQGQYVLNRNQNLISVDASKAKQIQNMRGNIHAHSNDSEDQIKQIGCKVPSQTDCSVLAHAYVLSNLGASTTAVSDDGGMKWVANDLQIPFITTLGLVHKMYRANKQTLANVKALAGYLAYEKDLPSNWRRESLGLFGVQLP